MKNRTPLYVIVNGLNEAIGTANTLKDAYEANRSLGGAGVKLVADPTGDKSRIGY